MEDPFTGTASDATHDDSFEQKMKGLITIYFNANDLKEKGYYHSKNRQRGIISSRLPYMD